MSESTGSTAEAPECRIISSSPILPLGKRTWSIERSTILPLCTGLRSMRPGFSFSFVKGVHLDGANVERGNAGFDGLCIADNGDGELIGFDVVAHRAIRFVARHAEQRSVVLWQVIISETV